ncbi:GFA family protein [Microbulbifer sp. THAF38]|uniref:GFA family protein n=1 Tax=Microbulbifer sp. THAF38 TaxID=2587856 RepID=UPI001268B199|nr:GFA family protein [Microbulbifer sp. THAF38]QFT56497.1 Glutathione-dependent formaldehyde-activating enzyme [Microbulbifer sp. THAF38]
MNDTNQVQGSCLCGSVTIKAELPSSDLGVCHCGMCKKWSGGPLLAVDCQTSVEISGEEHVSVFDSSDWAERGFCSNCGSHLFYRLKETQQYSVPAGIFELPPEVTMTHQIFIDEKPTYYSFANETRNITGLELVTEFSGE